MHSYTAEKRSEDYLYTAVQAGITSTIEYWSVHCYPSSSLCPLYFPKWRQFQVIKIPVLICMQYRRQRKT